MLIGFQKLTLVNFPRRVAAAVFLPGCNMRCGFCHNAELACASPSTGVEKTSSENIYFTQEEIFSYLEKRANVLSGVVLSGGEPLISPVLDKFIKKIKELRLALKIDTNGLSPEKLQKILYDKTLTPDMVAIDIKTSPERYIELTAGNAANISMHNSVTKKLILSLSILEQFKIENPFFEIEYRTVLVPGLVGQDEIKKIAQLIPKSGVWKLADFIPGNCLKEDWNRIKPYSVKELKAFEAIAKSIIPDTELR